MYPYMNEDVMWQRLKDIQAEMESSRLWAESRRPDLARWARWMGARVWWLAGLAMQRPPRRSPLARNVRPTGHDREIA